MPKKLKISQNTNNNENLGTVFGYFGIENPRSP